MAVQEIQVKIEVFNNENVRNKNVAEFAPLLCYAVAKD